MVIEQVVRPLPSPTSLAASLALAVVIGGSLAFRRNWPLLTYVVGSAALIVQSLWLDPSMIAPYANLVGLFSLGTYGTRKGALWGPVLLVPGVLAYSYGASELGAFAISVLAVWLAAWGLGYQLARGREQSVLVREAARREDLAEERVRIARELHDVVGHTVNLILVQAGASRLITDSDPPAAKAMLTDIEQAARQALGELDQMLGLLRMDSEILTQPGIRELPALCSRLGAVGLTVDLDVEPRALPPQLDIVAYRIVQEALTNALRHGKASRATVRISGADWVTIDIADTGHGPVDYEPGRGLRGMSERAALFGGVVEHHRTPDGFHVHTELKVP